MSTNTMLQPSASLTEWNRELERAFKQIELIGELELDEQDLEMIVSRLRAQMQRLGPEAFPEAVTASAPALLATYLVLLGVHRFADNTFWEMVRSDLPGLPASTEDKWRRAFLRALSRYHLPTFAHMDGLKFIGPILAHGGIPASYLPTFFRALIWPAVSDARWAGMSAGELLSEWMATPWALASVQQPTQRFLRFGGRVAETFVERCLQMAEQRGAENSAKGADHWGLPRHVVEAFERFLRSPDAKASRAGLAPYPKYRRPQLTLDLMGAGMVMALPAQVLAPDTPAEAVYWHIEVDGVAQRLPVKMEVEGQASSTEEAIYCFQAPPSRCRARLMVANAPAREWDWEFAVTPFPRFVFEAGSGRLVERELLPGQPLWFLAPKGASLSGARAGETALQPLAPRGGVDDLALGWGAFEAQLYAVSRYHKLALTLASNLVYLRVDEDVMPAMRLVGDPVGGAHTYAEPPELAISLDAPMAAAFAADWTLESVPIGQAYPAGEQEMSLESYLTTSPRDGETRVPLRGLLGEKAVGHFRVTARGPQGRKADFFVTLAPGLALATDDDGRAMRLTLPPTVVTVDGAPVSDERSCQFQLGPDERLVRVSIGFLVPDGRRVEVPLELTPHPLRWALVGLEAAHSRISLEARLVNVSLPLLEQANDPAMLVEFPQHHGGIVAAELRLVEPSGSVLQALSPETWPHGEQGGLRRGRFRLALLKSSVRASNASALRLVLRIKDGEGRWQETPVAAVTQDWAPRDVQAHVANGTLHLQWEERLALDDRHVWFWDLWRPWNTPTSFDIPPSSRGAANLPLPPNHVSGAYRVQLGLNDPWNPIEPKKPERGDPGTCEVMSGSEDARAQRLESLDSTPLARAEKFLAAGYTGKSQFPETYYLEAEVRPEHIGPLFLTLLDAVEAPSSSKRAWTEALQRIFCLYRATDVQRMLGERFRTATPGERERVVKSLLGLGWLRSVGPRWRPQPYPMPDQGRATALQPPLADEAFAALWDLWLPLGLGAERWPLSDGAINRLTRAFGEEAMAAVRPWRSGARVLHQGRPQIIKALDWDEDQSGSPEALWRQTPPVGLSLTFESGRTLVVNEETSGALELAAEVPPAFIENFEPDVSLYLGLPEAWYEGFLADARLTSSGLSDGTLAQGAWLRRVAKDLPLRHEAANWCEDNVQTMAAAMEALRAAAPHVASALEVVSKRPYRVLKSGEAGYALATLPFLVGAIALANRALARGVVPSLGRLTPRDLDALTIQANHFAPERFCRDLTMVELLLGMGDRPAARKERR